MSLPFAPLKPLLAQQQQNHEDSFAKLAEALRDFGSPVRIHVRLLHGDKVEHWDVQGGPKASAQRNEPQKADVLVVVKHETWLQIAQGRLAPYAALFAGKLRVGGNFETAKSVTRHLSDSTVPYMAPC